MLFSKAIQIKMLVNRLNQERKEFGCDCINFECDMFSMGKWAVDICPNGSTPFYSREMEEIMTLYAGGGFRMFISAHNDKVIMHLQ